MFFGGIMNEFKIVKVNIDKIKYVAIAKGWDSNNFSLLKFSDKLDLRDGDVILVDKLLKAGNNNNRFWSIDVVDGVLNMDTCKLVEQKDVPDELKKPASNFLREHTRLLKYCFLPSSQKELILSGNFI